MTRNALMIMREEHDALGAVLHALRYLVKEIRDCGKQPDFVLFRAMLYYIDAFPERLHHRKEDQYLFPKLRARTHAADAILDRLEHDHAHSEQAVRELEHALLEYEQRGESAFPAFAQAAEAYCSFYADHMRTEEQRILPLAASCLTAEDWREIDQAFRENRDPLTGTPHHEFEHLFTKIVNLAPAPIGLGAPMGMRPGFETC